MEVLEAIEQNRRDMSKVLDSFKLKKGKSKHFPVSMYVYILNTKTFKNADLIDPGKRTSIYNKGMGGVEKQN